MSNKVTTLLIFGKTGSGISSTANTILGEDKFQVVHGMVSSQEKFCSEETSRNREKIVVIPIPDLFSNSSNEQITGLWETFSDKWMQTDITAILMIIRGNDRFTDDQYDIYQKMKSWVGDDVMLRKLIVVFTACNQVNEIAIENLSGKLQEILTDANKRYVFIDNNGSPYTKEMQVCRLLTAVDRLTDPMAPERRLSLFQKIQLLRTSSV